MKLRQDIEQIKQRWRDFNTGRNSRPMIIYKQPKRPTASMHFPHPYSLAFNDVSNHIDTLSAWLSSFDYYADTIPFYHVTFNPDHLALFLGADLDYNSDSPNTTWTKPLNRALKNIEICFDKKSRWWVRTVDCMTQLKKSLPTDVLIAGPPIQGGLDCLAALRGMEQMMIDIMEDPDTVKQKLKEINTAIIDVRNALWEAQEGAVQGGINRFGMYSDTFTDVPQCDASCMINNEMFEIFQVPALKKEISLLQNAVYHLDGPGALQHRNSLYKMDTLAMIQWQPGYGNYEKDWRWLYDEIDQKGKGQVIQSFVKMDRNEMINFWKESSSKNIVFIIEPDQIEGIDSFAAELESAGR